METLGLDRSPCKPPPGALYIGEPRGHVAQKHYLRYCSHASFASLSHGSGLVHCSLCFHVLWILFPPCLVDLSLSHVSGILVCMLPWSSRIGLLVQETERCLGLCLIDGEWGASVKVEVERCWSRSVERRDLATLGLTRLVTWLP